MNGSESILVTGAAGHLGSHLAAPLRQAGFQVRGTDRASPPADWPGSSPFTQADLSDAAALAPLLEGVDTIVHCASIHPWKSYSDTEYIDANVRGTWVLYDCAARAGVSRIVLTSSIAAAGYSGIPPEDWPVAEDREYGLHDIYGFTKRAQEDVARVFANDGRIRSIALRPPAFMPRPPIETAFALTGCFAVVSDIASAHVAAAKALSPHNRQGCELAAFEAVYCTNRLPYTAEDAAALAAGADSRTLVRKHWPRAYDWLVAQGYKGMWLPAVYDLTKAGRLLGWEPALNFEQWTERMTSEQ